MERLLSGVNIHLKGVALRIHAKDSLSKGDDRSLVERDLFESEELLEKAGDPVQLSKTLLEKAKLELGRGNHELARDLIRRAKRTLGGYGKNFSPLNLVTCWKNMRMPPGPKSANEEFLERYMEVIESLYPVETQSEILNKLLISTSRMFGAERSGFFWFPADKNLYLPEFRAARNLSERDVRADSFKKCLSMIQKTFRFGATSGWEEFH